MPIRSPYTSAARSRKSLTVSGTFMPTPLRSRVELSDRSEALRGTQRAQRGAVGPRRRVAGTEAASGAFLGDAPPRQLVGGATRRHTFRAGELEHSADGVGDLGGALPGAVA